MINVRAKGRRGQQEAKNLLLSRDWQIAELNAGQAVEDILATDPDGRAWSVEVKRTRDITLAHRVQAVRQAKARRKPWMLMSHIEGTASWLIQRQGREPAIWTRTEE
jgi:Holliday junction resolvase-like predicted endonuclease